MFCESQLLFSKVNKTTGAKVAVIFAHFRFSVINIVSVLLQQSKFEFVSKANPKLIVATTQKVIPLNRK
jgi:hypothetical protein